jgi:pilus assembly protein CpaC
MAACGSFLTYRPVRATEPAPTSPAPTSPTQPQQTQTTPAGGAQAPGGPLGKLTVTVGKSLIIDSPLDIRRISVANGDLAEAVAVNPKEVLINGKAPGETSLIVWQQNGTRLIYDLTVRMSSARLDAVRQQLARDFPNENISVTFENDTAFVRGTVKDVTAAERVMAVVATLGRAVNLLHVDMPPVEPQVVLKVRFANVDRSVSTALGVDFFTGAFNQTSAIGTGSPISTGNGTISVGQAVNILLARKDINLAATITALQSQRLLEMLAEPNLLTISGQQASFLAGGEFPFPMVQPSSGQQAISIMWREYGVRLNFLPVVTPRGTIRLKVAPEVSSLDYTNAVTVQGVTVPGLSTRRVQTDVELETGQTFVIAGLLDNQTSENLAKIPGISAIPVLGKLFQSKTVTKSNSELLVIITPELVRPMPAGQKPPELKFPRPFMSNNTDGKMEQPGLDVTGPVPVKAAETVPVETLMPKGGPPPAAMPSYQMVPVMPAAAPPPVNPGLTPPPMGQQGGSNGNSGSGAK